MRPRHRWLGALFAVAALVLALPGAPRAADVVKPGSPDIGTSWDQALGTRHFLPPPR